MNDLKRSKISAQRKALRGPYLGLRYMEVLVSRGTANTPASLFVSSAIAAVRLISQCSFQDINVSRFIYTCTDVQS